MSDAIYLLTPPGRMVQGDIFTPGLTDFDGNETDPVWYVGLAIPKGPAFDAFWSKVYAKAKVDFPGGEYNDPLFKWKYLDGDSEANIEKTGFKGHHVLRLSSRWEPEVFDQSTPPQVVAANSAAAAGFKKGFWYQISISVKGNGKKIGTNAGVYLNLSQIQLVGYAEEIRSGPDAATVFAVPPVLPPGVSATPLGVSAPSSPPPTATAGPSSPPAPSSPPPPAAGPGAGFLDPTEPDGVPF